MKTRRLGRKAVGLMLTLAMVLSLMSGISLGAYADSEMNSFADYVLKPGDDDATVARKVVSFGDKDWYIIADDSSNPSAPTVTLFAREPIKEHGFNLSYDDDIKASTGQYYYSNYYSKGSVQAALQGPLNKYGSLESVADKVATVPSLTTYAYNSNTEVYDTVENVKLYLLSTEEANNLPQTVRKCTPVSTQFPNEWWLRSPGNDGQIAAYVDGETGTINRDGKEVTNYIGIRPALKVDLTKAEFDFATK